jgi:hypothetical protein
MENLSIKGLALGHLRKHTDSVIDKSHVMFTSTIYNCVYIAVDQIYHRHTEVEFALPYNVLAH